jgi:4'-phosphopantetheinyl transferase
VSGVDKNPIAPGTLHVWTVSLEADEEVLAASLAALSPAEIDRARRFAGDERRVRFVLFHGVLRSLLGAYTGRLPGRIDIEHGSHGKPRLREPASLHFNSSNGGDVAMYALARDGEVGVDVERLAPLGQSLEATARSCCCDAEMAELGSLPREERLAAFLRAWTRKEAYVKAIGRGLAIPLDRVHVSLVPRDAPRVIRVAARDGGASTWTLHHLEPTADCIAAVAYRGARRELTTFGPLTARELVARASAGRLIARPAPPLLVTPSSCGGIAGHELTAESSQLGASR